MNFACPLNSVEKDCRNTFLDRNPEVLAAWQEQVKKE
jgi:hypothetical protein